MRRLLVLLAACAALPAFAADPLPQGLEPIPEPPAPPPGYAPDPSTEPQVTITTQGENRVEEFRINGKLYMMRITPPGGTPYYLMDNRGDGEFSRIEGLDSGLRVPQWVIMSF